MRYCGITNSFVVQYKQRMENISNFFLLTNEWFLLLLKFIIIIVGMTALSNT